MNIKYDNSFINDEWLKEEFEDIVSRFSRGDEKPIPNTIRTVLEYIFEKKLLIKENGLSNMVYKWKNWATIDSKLIIKQVELLVSYGNVGSHFAIDKFNIDSETAIKFLWMFYLYIYDEDPNNFAIELVEETVGPSNLKQPSSPVLRTKKEIPNWLMRSRAVGSISFIKYYEHWLDHDIHAQMEKNENYKESSIRTKVSSARWIMKSDHIEDVLELIANSTIISEETRSGAEKYLEEFKNKK